MSKRQKMIYEYIKTYIKENHYSPTVREINDGVGLNSTSTVHSHLKKLRENRHIDFVDFSPRTIRVLKGSEVG